MRYTATLFDNFMKYKGFVAKVQDILSHGDQYSMSYKDWCSMPKHISNDSIYSFNIQAQFHRT